MIGVIDEDAVGPIELFGEQHPRQSMWQRVKRGEIEAVHVRRGRQKGLRLKLNGSQPDLFNQAS